MTTVFRAALFILTWLFSATALAQSGNVALKTSGPGYTEALSWAGSLLLVLALFLLMVWLIRKSGQIALPGKSRIGVVTALSLGMREKLVLVRVGEKQVLLGVTPNRIDKLMVLEGDERLYQDGMANEHGNFSATLKQLMKGNKHG